MRVVLDTNVVASALLWRGAPNELLRRLLTSGDVLFSSTPLMAELTEILSRTKFDRKIAASGFNVDQLVDLYGGLVSLVRPIAAAGLTPDPDDDVVVGTALAAQADLIVTGDRVFLAVERYDGGRIVSVSEALQMFSETSR